MITLITVKSRLFVCSREKTDEEAAGTNKSQQPVVNASTANIAARLELDDELFCDGNSHYLGTGEARDDARAGFSCNPVLPLYHDAGAF